MRPTIITKPAFQIIGLQYRGGHEKENCHNLWDSFCKRFDEVIHLAKKPITAFGIHTNFDEDLNIWDHTAGLEAKDLDSVPENLIFLKIQEQEYAVFECTFSSIMETVETYKNWWFQSDFERSGGPELLQFNQPFDKDFDPQKPEALIYFHIPIRKK